MARYAACAATLYAAPTCPEHPGSVHLEICSSKAEYGVRCVWPQCRTSAEDNKHIATDIAVEQLEGCVKGVGA